MRQAQPRGGTVKAALFDDSQKRTKLQNHNFTVVQGVHHRNPQSALPRTPDQYDHINMNTLTDQTMETRAKAPRTQMANTHNTAPTQFISANGIRYAYRRFGAARGTPIVLMPHFRAGLDNWDPQLTDGLAEDRPVILFNNAGVASSSGEPSNTIAGMAKHVIAFVNALGLTQVDLLGFSLGGFVAQEVVLQSPDLIRRLILAGTGPQGGEGMDSFKPEVAEHATSHTPVVEDFLYLFFAPSETSQAAGLAFWDRRHSRTDQDVPSSKAAMRAQGEAIAGWGVVPKTDRYSQLKKIKQPVLVVNGHDDIMVPTINSFILQQHIPNATLIIYPDSGHGAIFQYPDMFVSHARLFLDDGRKSTLRDGSQNGALEIRGRSMTMSDL